MSFLTEATATLDYDTYDYSLPHTKTIDLIGEEFVKKESNCGESPNSHQIFQLSATTAVPGSYTTTLPQFAHSTSSLPNISSATEDNGVHYYNLDDLSRSFTGNFVDNFVFDLSENLEYLVKNDPDQIPSITTTSDFAKVQVVSLPTQPLPASSAQQFANSKPMTISLPTIPDPRFAPLGSISQVSRSTPTTCSTSMSSAPFSFPTIDTTKLTGQLTVVQELPEVGRLVFQEIKTENDSIANILDGMKTEDTIPLDYTVSPTSTSPLNLVNCINKKGVKRVVAPVQQVPPGAKRVKNVIVVQGQNGQIIQTTTSNGMQSYNQVDASRTSPHHMMGNDLVQSSEVITSTTNRLMLDPPSPQNFSDMESLLMKKELKPKTVSPKSNSFINSKFNGNASVPSSKICNWVFENGQVCGKTFSKSYNLVVHMRMHEDIRPFACNHCDQTFRQKAHLQRHETTHGIQTKNFYRASPSSKKKKKKSPCNKTNKNLQDRLSRISDNLNRPAHRSPGESEDDTEADDYMEDDEDDLYVPNSQKNKPMPARKYSDNDLENREDTELDSHQLEVEVSRAEAELANREKIKSMLEAMQDPLSLSQDGLPLTKHQSDSKGQYLVKQECIMDRKENLEILNLTHRPEDDENSTVQDIIKNVTNTPTLEQKLESSSILNCENVLLNTERMNNNKAAVIVSIPSMFTSVSQSPQYSTKLLTNSLTETFSTSLPPINNSRNYSLAYSVASTSSPQVVSSTQFPTHHLQQLQAPTTLYTSNKTILQHAQTTSVPAPTTFSTFTSSVGSSKNQLVIENLEEHSPEIQAEILNALLADEGCMSGKGYSDADQVQEVIIGLENHKVTPSFRPRTRSRSLSSGADDPREEEIYRDPGLPQGWWVLKRRRVESNIWDNYYYSPQGYRFRGKFEIKKFLDEGILPKGVKNPTLRFPPVPVEQLPLREDNYSPRKSSQSPAMPSTNLLLLQDTNTLAQTLIANLKPEPIEHLQNALNGEPRVIPDCLSMGMAASPLSSVS